MHHHPARTRRTRITRYRDRPYRVSRPVAVLLGVAALLALLFMMSY